MLQAIVIVFVTGIACLFTADAEARARDERGAMELGRPAATVAQGWSGGRQARSAPSVLDSDRDGIVSSHEAIAHYRWMFELLDENRTGALRPSQFVEVLTMENDPQRRKAKRAHLEDLFERLDANGDGEVPLAEFLAAAQAHFTSCDKDGDGIISVGEFRSRRPL